jgi:hypothetical protein
MVETSLSAEWESALARLKIAVEAHTEDQTETQMPGLADLRLADLKQQRDDAVSRAGSLEEKLQKAEECRLEALAKVDQMMAKMDALLKESSQNQA